MKKRRTIERCVRLGVAIACVSAATVLRAGDRAEVSVAGSERADTASFRDIYPDTWVATDAVGRTMPTEEEVGLPKNDQRRVVGIFYITWHTQGLHNLKSPYTADVTKILEQDPSARLDAHHPLWKEGSYHWGEPEMGYFLSQDEWVIRKDVSMLADAGVDVMIMDVTNAVRYWDEWDVIFRTMQRMKAEGNKVPKFCFWAFNGPVITVVQDLYDRIYKPGLYSDLWFEWDGKPLLLYNSRPGIDAAESSNPNTNPHYDPDAVTNPANPHYGDPDYTEKVYKDYTSEVKDFFTLRTMWWGYYEWGGERFVGTEDNWSFGYNMADPKVAALKPEELLSTHNGRRAGCRDAGPASDDDGRGRFGRRREIVVARIGRTAARRARPARSDLCALARQDGRASRALRHLLSGTLGRGPRVRSRVPLYQRLERVDGRQIPARWRR